VRRTRPKYGETVAPAGGEEYRPGGRAARPQAGAADDLVELGGHLTLWPWRGMRGRAMGLAAAALAAGLVIGFGTGRLTAPHKPAVTPKPAITAISAPSGTDLPQIGSGIVFTGNRCAVQHGRKLQLGIEVANESGHTVSVLRIGSVIPGHGLRQLSSETATCGSVPVPGGKPVTSIEPGSTAWLTATFAVLVRCPAPQPVLFVVGFGSQVSRYSDYYQGFPDLGSVPYTGCREHR
jgi:hypothetical protein